MAEVRVSCSGLVYAPVDDCILGHYSRSKLKKKGKWFMSPFGGRNMHDETVDSFMKSLNVRYESKERQLNLWLPEKNVERFVDWLYEGQDREIVPLRELGEELVDEEHVFPDREVPFTLDRGFTLRKLTERAGGGPPTFYFFDVYRMQLENYDAFRQAENREGCGIRLVTRKEIDIGKMNRPGLSEHNAELGDMFQYFDLPKQELEARVTLNAKDNVEVTDISDEIHKFERFL
ncbi:MAG: hypothetical protein U9R08_04000 [Nanoarchaeota archaeon]|nr:hypothetical protein [Nanoarchaeota archaeon]